jgi:hypothetical protein
MRSEPPGNCHASLWKTGGNLVGLFIWRWHLRIATTGAVVSARPGFKVNPARISFAVPTVLPAII